MSFVRAMKHPSTSLNRREFLWRSGGGLGGVALASLLCSEGLLADTPDGGALPPQFAPRARRVVQLFMSGGASQCDLFDFKPKLVERNGQKWDPGEDVKLFESKPGKTMASPWKWKRYGECGQWLSELVAPLGECVDDMAFVHSMVSNSNVHAPGHSLQSTGFVLPGFPGAGAWISYALGRMTDELPTFVVLPDPRGLPTGGTNNWGAGFLSSRHQGTIFRPNARTPISDLTPRRGSFVNPDKEIELHALLRKLNEIHLEDRPGDSRLEARIAAYEMAHRLQSSAAELLDLSREPQHIQTLYGLDDPTTEAFGRNCLVARRLLERGVRFVQVWSGAAVPGGDWDSHRDIKREHSVLAPPMARGAAGLVRDLKQRGLLDDTIVFWTTEFGRMPCSQGEEGRDHNPAGYTNWFAGGGIKPGFSYGATDEWSYKTVEKPVSGYDLHATILHLLGIDHERLTYRHNGADRRLTDVHGAVIHDLIA